MKKLLSVFLSLILLLSLSGCACAPLIRELLKPYYDDPSASPYTWEPGSSPDTLVTNEPDYGPEREKLAREANDAFIELDLELFREMVSSSADNLHQYVSGDPAYFGIDPDEVGPAGWGELTYEEHINTMDYFRDVLERLGSIERGLLNETNRHGYDAIKRSCEWQLAFEDYYYYDEPLEPINGIQTLIPLSMALFEIRREEDLETYLTLVEDIPRYMDQLAAFETEKAERGLFMCETALDQVLESLDRVIEKGEESVLITCFEEDIIERARELGKSSAECGELIERNKAAVLNGVLPAYSRLKTTLSSLRGKCRDFVGAARIGAEMKAYYRLRFGYEGASREDLGVIKALLSDMGSELYSDVFTAVNMGPEDLLDMFDSEITFGSVEDNVSWLTKLTDEYYPELPEYVLRTREVPDELADDFSPAAYLVPAFDDSYNNLILVNPKSETSCDLFTIAHETVPGHLFQYVYTRGLKDLSLTQQLLEPTGYAEAWTVFTEYFVARHCDEKNKWLCLLINSNDAFCNIFLPAYVSILVNDEGMSLDEVTNYLRSYGMEDSAEVFYEYAVTMPYYAASYAVGFAYMLKIYNNSAPSTPSQHRDFFESYMSFGPCDMDVMRDCMR